jgi:hypothetical protein
MISKNLFISSFDSSISLSIIKYNASGEYVEFLSFIISTS